LKNFFLIIFLALTLVNGQAQDFSKLLPEQPPKTAKENTRNLFAGLAIQVAGLGLCTASVYFITEANEEDMEIGFSGFGMGLGLAATGTVLMISSIHNMVVVRKSYHDLKKDQKKKSITFHLESTQYGIGLVCKF
jgi:hypothetical protein